MFVADNPINWGVAFLSAFLIALACGPRVIESMRVLKFGQNISSYVEGHAKKQGTPTMGGILIILGVVGGTLVAWLVQPHISRGVSVAPGIAGLIAVTAVFLGMCAIGFLDDYLSIKRGKNLGLTWLQKISAQFAVAGLFALWLALNAKANYTTIVTFPIFSAFLDLKWGYYVLAVLWIVGISNATNLTDGLDGLLGGTSILAAVGVAFCVHALGTPVQWFGYALAGATLGFLWFNAYPAKIFMGDTGSLGVGAGLAAMALVGKEEVLVLIFSLIFLCEMVSVMIQVGVFKLSRIYRRRVLKQPEAEGFRVFKMAPLHHHFEKAGVPETTVVVRMCIAGALALMIGMLLA